MCEKYVNEKLIQMCSEINDRDDCGNACNHCPYSLNYLSNVDSDEFNNFQEYERYILEEEEKQNERDLKTIETIKKASRIFKKGFKISNIIKLKNVEIFASWLGSTNIFFENNVFSLGYDEKGTIYGCTWKY